MKTFTYFCSVHVYEKEGNIKDQTPYTTHCEVTLNNPITTIRDVLHAQDEILKKYKMMCIILNFQLLRQTY